jgi:magnesium-transporting ATPase (P-type)
MKLFDINIYTINMKNRTENRNLNEYATQTKFRLVLWFILILFVVGIGLIWWFYGRNAAVLGFLCLLGAGIPIGLITIFLLGLDKIVKKPE